MLFIYKVSAGPFLQRLFSNFANGWAGAGMLLQRGLAGSILLHNCYIQIQEGSVGPPVFPVAVGTVAGLFLLAGLWTPIAGAVACVTQVWVLLQGVRESLPVEVAAILGLTSAMIGPGAWSVDARIFGRKHIAPKHPQK